MLNRPLYMKIILIGYMGSGKTTLDTQTLTFCESLSKSDFRMAY